MYLYVYMAHGCVHCVLFFLCDALSGAIHVFRLFKVAALWWTLVGLDSSWSEMRSRAHCANFTRQDDTIPWCSAGWCSGRLWTRSPRPHSSPRWSDRGFSAPACKQAPDSQTDGQAVLDMLTGGMITVPIAGQSTRLLYPFFTLTTVAWWELFTRKKSSKFTN